MLRTLAILFAFAAIPASANPYLAELIQIAGAKHLHENPQWHSLLHYKKHANVIGLRSLADDPRFFNAPSGKTNPQAELEATLAAFFSDEEETDKTQNPQCRFIARYRWLKVELNFDPARLPEQPCLRFNNWHDNLNPGRITLVFASAYLNNPSSAYGHTLLRIDRADQEDNTSLIAYAISYAANADDANALIFALKGLFGGYRGNYTMSPYYMKVAEYNDLENRDLWEYELDLSPDEIERILMHVWELGPIAFDYYFFDENCAYQLLHLIDTARPSLQLADRFPLWAIPADTVRAVTESTGLVRRTTYRPSRSTVIKTRLQSMSSSEVALSAQLADGTLLPDALPQLSQPDGKILDLAFDYLDYRRASGSAKEPAVGERLMRLLSARSKLDESSELQVPTPSVRPDQGHRSARIGLGAGSFDGQGFQEIRLRPAYHDLMDPQAGFLAGSQIDFFNVALRHRNGNDHVFLERLDIAHVASLSPRDALIKPLSWRADFGADRLRRGDGTDTLRGRISILGGYTYRTGACCIWNAMLGADLQSSGHLRKNYAFGPGLELNGFMDLTQAWRIGLSARQFNHIAGERHWYREAKIEARYSLSSAWALRIEAGEQREFGASFATFGASLNYFF